MKKGFSVFLLFTSLCWGADGPLLNSTSVPRQPPPGIAIPQDIRTKLETESAELAHEIEECSKVRKDNSKLLKLLPDVQIFYNAVRYALEEDLFYKPEDFEAAARLLAEGKERARLLQEGKAPWSTATGLVVRGYRSKVDGSVQPYGLVVPSSYQAGPGNPYRLDLWFHGRNNKLSELSFLTERQRNRGEFTPENTFVLHPYGRYCNAFKFAGETDVFEAMDHAQRNYPIDENRISVRGFSMGGAGAWHMAVHHASLWAAAQPGAGFVDTYIFQNGAKWPSPHPWYEQRLWHLYDCLDYAANLFNCPVVAYSGEIDGQRQAAELMTAAMAAEGLPLVHIIGPKTGHQFERRAKEQIASRMDELVSKGRNFMPKKVRFTTWTLRYNQMAWITVDEMERHWERARVEAEIKTGDRVDVSTINVNALTLSMPAGKCLLSHGSIPEVRIDNQLFTGPAVKENGWSASFHKQGSRWQQGNHSTEHMLRKRHGLQGPIDDAFMDSFVMVRPTGKFFNERVERWTGSALTNAVREWRMQFRGEPRIINDTDLRAEDIAASNLVLWGDPRSNRLLGRILSKLPIRWNAGGVYVNGKSYAAHVPLMIYPNPLNPDRYIVLNSGFTFADAAPTSNALQIPELPDYAIVNVDTQQVTDAGFFDEQWRYSFVR
jgi:pimeloyl-ACP methyl ester carboxylesterase